MLKISRFDLKLPAELVQTCAALRERELAKFIATNNEGEFQHTIEVKSEKEHFVNFELSNLEITFKDGRFVAQIAQVLKVFQAPEQESQQQQPAPSQQQPSNVGTVTSHGSFEKQSPNVTHLNERLVSPTSGPDAVNLFRNTQYRNSKEISASQNVSQTTSVQPRQMPNTGVNSNTAEEEDDDIIVVKDEDMISRRSKNVAEVTIEPSAAGEPSSSQPSQIYPYSLSQVHLNAPSTITSMSNTEQLVQPSTSQVGSNVPPPPTTPGQMFLHRKMARMQQVHHSPVRPLDYARAEKVKQLKAKILEKKVKHHSDMMLGQKFAPRTLQGSSAGSPRPLVNPLDHLTTKHKRNLRSLLTYGLQELSASCVAQRHLMPPMQTPGCKNKYKTESAVEYLMKVSELGFGTVETRGRVKVFKKRPFDELSQSSKELLARIFVEESAYKKTN